MGAAHTIMLLVKREKNQTAFFSHQKCVASILYNPPTTAHTVTHVSKGCGGQVGGEGLLFQTYRSQRTAHV